MVHKPPHAHAYCIINLFLVGASTAFEIENMSRRLKETELDLHLIAVSKDFKVFGLFLSIILLRHISLISICESLSRLHECTIETCAR